MLMQFTGARDVVKAGFAEETPFKEGFIYTMTEAGQNHLGVRTVKEALALEFGAVRPLDKCREPGCERLGVPGNENIIKGRPVCDYCHAKMRQAAREAERR